MKTAGEFERIDIFLRAFQAAGGALSGPGVLLGPGDDAAVLAGGAPLAVTTDALMENVHFRRDWSSWEQVGHKALAVNLSDLAAMGARPLAFTCAVGLPATFGVADLEALARGMGALASRSGAILVGGNFTAAGEISITITAFGTAGPDLLRRDAARPGDSVLLVGDVGTAAAELRALRAGQRLPPGRSALLTPEPLAAGLKAVGRARCAIDVSDGLVQDLGHVAKASGVRIRVDFARLPASERFRALTANATPQERACLLVAGGEDYALIVVAPQAEAAALTSDLGGVVIGTAEQGSGVSVDGLPPGTETAGFDHFRG